MKVALALSLSLFALGCGTPAPVADAGTQAPDSGPPPCDPAKCAANNICVANKCSLKCARHSDCPDGYDCTKVEDQLVCTENSKSFGRGYFGYSCGVNGDKDCCAKDDARDYCKHKDQAFSCVGTKGDPDSYCTLSGCTADADCPGAYYCAEVDTGFKTTKKMCLKRGFCAPATGLVDCNDPEASFAKDAQGRGMCLRKCSTTSTANPCLTGTECLAVSGGQCWPKTKPGGTRTCYATKEYCGRCLSQNDCPAGGLCYFNTFTKERFCTQPCSGAGACPASPGGVSANACPANVAPKSSCTTCGTFTSLSQWGDQCFPDPAEERGEGCYFK